MAQFAFETVDVFTEERFGGNPLAVLTDARGMSPEAMQSIAREFNYSESTFVLPPADEANTARVRIFTPAFEIPFAGHPNVGTAFVLGRMGSVFGKAVGDILRFEEKAGLVEVVLTRRQGEIAGASIVAPRALERGEEVAPEVVAACATLGAHEISTSIHPPVFASVGLEFIIAEVASRDALARATADVSAFRRARLRYGGNTDRFSLFLYSRLSGSRVRARMFAPLTNVSEDPATGSASAALGALLASLANSSREPINLEIEQGVEMGRPSLISVRVGAEKERHRVAVAGSCSAVMRGVITA
jgi:trans-2,3-dihydro-3-hydroxyanthranilate isomerase